jgi:hypothetical protein
MDDDEKDEQDLQEEDSPEEPEWSRAKAQELFKLARKLACCVVPQEYGMSPEEKVCTTCSVQVSTLVCKYEH